MAAGSWRRHAEHRDPSGTDGSRRPLCDRLGDDPFSATLLQDWTAEGIDTSLILRDPTRMPGLYAITTDEAGERSFSYWRGQSAARRTLSLSGSEAVMAQAEQADLLLYSLITLAILDEPSREHLFDLAQRVRARGGRVAFDGNYRPRLFASQDEARDLCRGRSAAAISACRRWRTRRCWSTPSPPKRLQGRWQSLGAAEVVVKLGADGCLVTGVGLVPRPSACPRAIQAGRGMRSTRAIWARGWTDCRRPRRRCGGTGWPGGR